MEEEKNTLLKIYSLVSDKEVIFTVKKKEIELNPEEDEEEEPEEAGGLATIFGNLIKQKLSGKKKKAFAEVE